MYSFDSPNQDPSEISQTALFASLTQANIPTAHVPPVTPLDPTNAADDYFLTSLDKVGEQIDAFADEPIWLIWAELPDLFPPWTVPEDILAKNFFDEEELERVIEDDESEDDEDDESEDDEDDESEDDESEDDESEDDESEDDEADVDETDVYEDATEEEKALEPLLNPPMPEIDIEDSELAARLDFSYASAVEHLDRSLGALIGALEEQGMLDEITLVLTAQQGVAVGEHGYVGASAPMLYEELIHIPLLVRLPSAEQAGTRILGFTQPIDLFPTLLEFFELSHDSGQGRSLVPLIQGRTQTIREYLVSHSFVENGHLWTIRTPSRCVLIRETEESTIPTVQLYDKPDDRWEVNDLAQHFLEEVDAYTLFLPVFVDAARSEGEFEPPPLPKLES
ncbi:MAG: sulfatase-like hydrolase/transferase [Gemmataceae bacterium]